MLETTDAGKSSHLKVLGYHMVYGRPYSVQMYTNRVISKCWKLVWCMADLLYIDADKSSQQQVLETHMVYGRPYSMQMQKN